MYKRLTNEVDAFRTSVALYGDIEADLTDKFLLGLAVRFENYSDFGSTVNGKLTTRYKISNDWTFRAAARNVFRAPSSHKLSLLHI